MDLVGRCLCSLLWDHTSYNLGSWREVNRKYSTSIDLVSWLQDTSWAQRALDYICLNWQTPEICAIKWEKKACWLHNLHRTTDEWENLMSLRQAEDVWEVTQETLQIIVILLGADLKGTRITVVFRFHRVRAPVLAQNEAPRVLTASRSCAVRPLLLQLLTAADEADELR